MTRPEKEADDQSAGLYAPATSASNATACRCPAAPAPDLPARPRACSRRSPAPRPGHPSQQGHPSRSSDCPAPSSLPGCAPPRSAPPPRAPPGHPADRRDQLGDRVLGGHRIGHDRRVHRPAAPLQDPGLPDHLLDRVGPVWPPGPGQPLTPVHQSGRVEPWRPSRGGRLARQGLLLYAMTAYGGQNVLLSRRSAHLSGETAASQLRAEPSTEPRPVAAVVREAREEIEGLPASTQNISSAWREPTGWATRLPSISAGVCAAFTRTWVARSDHTLGDHRQEFHGRRRIGRNRLAAVWLPCLAADSPLSGPARHSAGRPNRRTAVAGASHGGRSARLADDQRDVAFGAALVTAVTGIGGHHPGPQLRLLLR